MIGSLNWEPPPKDLPFPKFGQLHLWLIGLEADAGFSVSFLSQEEKSRAERSFFPDGRRRFILARSAMRQILGKYLTCPPDGINFSYGKLGKPEISFPETDLRFNLTHSEDLALLAITRRCNVGIDVERVRERGNMLGIAKRIFPAEIVNSLRVLPKEPRTEMFVRHWTSLEARAKALGQGVFSNPADNVPCLNFQPAEGWMAAVAVESGILPAKGWRVFHFDTANFVA